MIVGYARKSKATRESDEGRVRLLQMMASRLKERSHVQRTYVIVSCNSKDPMSMRDMPRLELIDKIDNVDGTMQGSGIRTPAVHIALTTTLLRSALVFESVD